MGNRREDPIRPQAPSVPAVFTAWGTECLAASALAPTQSWLMGEAFQSPRWWRRMMKSVAEG